MATKIGSLLIDLNANVAQLQKDFAAAQKTMDGALGKMGAALKSFAGLAGAYLGGQAILSFVDAAIDGAVEIGRSAEQIGITTDALQEYRYAAISVGVASEDMDQVLRDLGDRMGDAAAGAQSFRETFAALGVDIYDAEGRIRPVEDVFLDVADGMAKADSDATRLFRSMELFGDQGARLLPLLKQGSAGVAALRSEAREFGLVTEDTIAQAQSFDRNLQHLSTMLQGVGMTIVEHALPALNEWSTQLVEAAKRGRGFGEEIATGFKIIISAGKIVTTIFETIGKALGAIAASVVELVQGNFRRAWEIQQESAEEAKRIWLEHGREVREIWTATGKAAETGAEKTTRATGRVFQGLNSAAEAAKKLQEEIAAALARDAELQRLADQQAALAEASKAAARQGMDAILQTSLMEAQATEDRLDDIRARLAIDLEAVRRAEEDGILDPELAQRQRVALHAQAEREMTEITRSEAAKREQEQIRAAQSAAAYFGGAFSDLLIMPLQEGFKGVEDILASIRSLLLDLLKRIAGSAIMNLLLSAIGMPVGGGGGLLSLLGFSEGGIVPGRPTPGKDSVVAALEPGEYVITTAAVRRYGTEFFDALNNLELELPRFSRGGMVEAAPAPAGQTLVVQNHIRSLFPSDAARAVNESIAPAAVRLSTTRQAARFFDAVTAQRPRYA